MAVADRTQRTITTLQGNCRLILRVRRCRNPACAWYHRAFRPEEEGKWALPHGEFGLDVIALVGMLRYTSHRSIPEIHQALRDRGVQIVERTVTHLLQRYEELVTVHLTDQRRLRNQFKVTTSYWPGLFHCYDQADLPRTNNDQEQYFGSARYLERRTTGCKQASPGMVIRGAVRVVASIASRLHPFSGPDLCPTDVTCWRTLRSELNHHHEARRMQYRFRKSPEHYLAALEEKLSKESLPP